MPCESGLDLLQIDVDAIYQNLAQMTVVAVLSNTIGLNILVENEIGQVLSGSGSVCLCLFGGIDPKQPDAVLLFAGVKKG